LLKLDKNNRHFKIRPTHIYSFSLYNGNSVRVEEEGTVDLKIRTDI
jgi:hypothetical protein